MNTKTQPSPVSKEMLASLDALRLLVREVGGNYLSALQADVARVQAAIRNAPKGHTPGQRRRQQMAKMQRWIHNLDVKPQKGRRRDLKELDRLITKLTTVVDTW